MPLRTLGRTGVKASLIGLGGWHLGFKFIDEDLSIRIIRPLWITARRRLDTPLKRTTTA